MDRDLAEWLIDRSAMGRDLTWEVLAEMLPDLTEEEFDAMWANRTERVVLQ